MPKPSKKAPPPKLTAAELARARSGRTVAFVLVGTMALWLLAQWLGPQLGLPGEYAILFDMAALAAFFWSMFVAFGLWRRRNER